MSGKNTTPILTPAEIKKCAQKIILENPICMSDKPTTVGSPKNFTNDDIDFEKADAFTDEEIEERAKCDPDSLPFSEEQLKNIKIRRTHKENE